MEAAVNLRPRQLEAVESLAPRITVAAGPGSGKTRVLVERIARGVRQGRLRLDRVLAITFTINAAAEMKKRLSAELPRAEVEAASISTIHSFCASLLRQYPVESRSDPAFRVFEEIEADVLKSRLMDELLDHIAATEPVDFAELALHVKGRSLVETLLTGYRQVVSQGGNLEHYESLLPIENRVMPEHVERVARTLCRFHAAYRSEKDRLSALDFDDLESRITELLGNDAIAGAVGRQYDEILVDEFQDTSRRQAEIVLKLAEVGAARLFVVGDPKQSIYGFRNARRENFDEAITQAGDAAIDLVEDFRSRPEVLAMINAYFSEVPNFAGDRPFLPLVAAGGFAPKQGPSVELLQSADRPEETQRLARAIRELGEGRGYDYGSIAMLFRSTPDMSMYEQALAAEGVPYFSESGRGYYGTREIIDIVNFLHVLDNDRDEIALATVLRSPMFGLSDDALYLLSIQAHGQGRDAGPRDVRLCDVLDNTEALPPADRAVVARFLDLRERLAGIASARQIGSLIFEIVRQTGYEETLRELPGGDRAVANVRKLQEMARVLEGSSIGAGTPGQFARVIDGFREEDVRESEAEIPISGGAVRMMTMHAAKGLQFGVVVLPDLGRQDASESAQVDYIHGVGLGCAYQDLAEDEPAKTPTLEQIRAIKKARNQEESERLLFVAMTRAEDHLLLSGSGTRGSRYQRILALGIPEFSLPDRVAVAQVAQAFRPVSAVPALATPTADESDTAAAITDIAEFAACPRRYYLGRYLGFSNDGAIVLDEDAPPARIAAAERGTLVHQRLAGTVAAPPEIEALARRFEQSELGRRVLALPGVQRELPILAQLDGRFLHGVLDLRAGNIIVDYKTGRRDDGRYGLQMQLYGLLTGSDELYLYYLDDGAESRIAPNPAVRDTVRQFFAAQQTLDFPPIVADHCVKCPFNGKQCLEPRKMQAAAGSV